MRWEVPWVRILIEELSPVDDNLVGKKSWEEKRERDRGRERRKREREERERERVRERERKTER